MRPEGADPEAQCPVDHKTRERWLEAARAKGQQTPAHPTVSPSTIPQKRSRFSLDNGTWQPLSTAPTTIISSSSAPLKPKMRSLSTDREISTIPRALSTPDPTTLNSAEAAALPPNNERDTGHDPSSGNWIYPSQEMFFAAMQRKGHTPEGPDMATIVPIHNAVNERAWAQIKDWESGRGSEACGGPRLVSFAGDSKALTPRARWKMLVGYEAPFDRHDWVVDRCGKKVDYVIDFYAGRKGEGKGKMGVVGPSFYLDVRPKLNSWEAVKTRVLYAVGL